jgi:hypothetical protein
MGKCFSRRGNTDASRWRWTEKQQVICARDYAVHATEEIGGRKSFFKCGDKRPLPRPQKKGLTFAALSGWGDKTATMTIIYRRLAQNFAMPAIAARLS